MRKLPGYDSILEYHAHVSAMGGLPRYAHPAMVNIETAVGPPTKVQVPASQPLF